MTLHRARGAALAATLTFYTGVAFGQTTATLTGTVTDPSGGAVRDVAVEVSYAATHVVVATTMTNADGAYTAVAPSTGIYEVRLRAAGFAESRRQWRAVAGETTRQDIALAIATFTEQTSATAALEGPRPSEVSIQSTALPTAVTVLTHEELSRTNVAQDVGTLFRRVPGALAHNIDQGETGTAIKFRGFSSSTHGADTAVYIDGIPQNLPSAAINHGMNDMSWLTPDMIERIEVIKGPFSALYGDQNRAGAVNIITRSTAETSVAGTIGSFGNKHLSAVLSKPVGSVQTLLVGDLFNISGYRTNDKDTRGTLFGKATMVRGGSQWAVRGTFYKADWRAPGFLNVASVIAGTAKPTDRDPTAPPLWGKGHRTSIVVTRTPARGEAGLHVSAAVEDYSRTRALGANTTDFNVQMDDRWITQARVVENLVFGVRAGVAVGVELRGDRGDSINQRWPAGTPDINYTWNQDLTLLTYAAFAHGQVKPIESIKLIGGARIDTFDYDIHNRKLPAASVKYTKSVATPRGGIVWTPVKALDLFTNVGQGFRSPNQTEISPSGALGPLGAPGGTPYADLAVPKVKSYDFGATASMTNRWSVTAAAYHTFNEVEILQVAPGVFSSVGDTVRNGWEVESRVEASRQTTVYGSLAEITKAKLNNPPPNAASLFLVPKHMVKGGVAQTVGMPSGQLLLNADAYYMSGIPFFTGPPLNQSGVSRAYARYDVRGTYELGRLQYTVYGTFQPNSYISEAISVIAAGLFYDPRPKTDIGLSVRYRF